MILDTSTIIDILRGFEPSIEFVKRIEKNTRFSISTITVFELYSYFETNKLDEFFDSVHIVPVSKQIAQKAGEIAKTLIDSGKTIDNEDCIIAATAIMQKKALITNNTKHFCRIQGLSVISY